MNERGPVESSTPAPRSGRFFVQRPLRRIVFGLLLFLALVGAAFMAGLIRLMSGGVDELQARDFTVCGNWNVQYGPEYDFGPGTYDQLTTIAAVNTHDIWATGPAVVRLLHWDGVHWANDLGLG